MPAPRALQIHAGPRARAHLRERGLRPQDVKVVAGAAGGPKGLVLLPLDEFIFGHWLPKGGHEVDLIGASIGAWRMAAACAPNPVQALQRLGHDYIHERYGHDDGAMPGPDVISERFAATLDQHFEADLPQVLSHPRWRLQILVSRGRGLLKRPGATQMKLGFAATVLLNAFSRRLLHTGLERVVFHASSDAPAWLQDNIPTRSVRLTADNFKHALLASCTIPFWLATVHDIPGAPPGAYWDGGLTDYHVHLPYRQIDDGLALIPHFQPRLVPGWLDKPLRHRHGATPALDNAIVLSPSPQWMAQLPGGKIPDRSDFKRFMHDPAQREHLWRSAWQASRQLADEWAEWLAQPSIDCLPLA